MAAIALTTLARLLRLRALLLEAQAAVGDTSETGTHKALVLLDGACEFALELAGRERGIQEKRDMANVYATLVEEGDLQPIAHWKGVRDLHKARNQAQHQGILARHDQLPGWADDADRFVRAMVPAIFGVQLGHVHLADAIKDRELRAALVAAEDALDGGDYADTVERAYAAFSVARQRYLEHREREAPYPSSRFPGWGHAPTPQTQEILGRAEEFVEVAPFAPDFGEYLWFANEVRLARSGVPRTEDDAHRALVFVLDWIRRLEGYLARYPTGALAHYRRTARAPRTGASPARPHIAEIAVEGSSFHGDVLRVDLRVQLADLPENDQHQWLQLLNEDFSRRDPADPESDWGVRMFDLTGRVFLHPPLDVDPAELVGELRAAIARTNDRFAEWHEQQAERQSQADVEVVPYRDAILRIRDEGRAVVLGVSASRDEPAFVGRWETEITVTLAPENDDFTHELFHQALVQAEQRQRYLRTAGAEITFYASSATPDEVAADFARAAQTVRESQRRRRVALRERERKMQELERALQDEVGTARSGP